MFTFLHAADIHLDSPLVKLEHYEGAPVEALRQATRRALENLVSVAIDEKVNFVLISGDLYDGDWKDYNTGLYFVSQMAKLREADIPVYIVAGNHDAASRTTKTLRLPDNVHLFPTDSPATCCLNHIGAAIHGQGFPTQAVRKELSALYPPAISGYFNIGMLHTCANGREGHEPYSPCTVEGLVSKDYDYWALGHVHQREILCDDPPIVFPGNIQGRNIRETGPKGCMLVRVNGNEHAAVHFQPLDVMRWLNAEIDASDAAHGYDVVDRVNEHLETSLEKNDGFPLAVRIQVRGASSASDALASDPERWTNEIRSGAMELGQGRVWIEKVKLRTAPEICNSLMEDGDARPSGPVGEILRLFDEIRSDPNQLQAFGDALNELWRKLPREFRESSDVISPDDKVWLARMLDQVRPMLLGRLMSKV